MSDRNGNPIVQFPKNVPIIGQAFTLKNFFVTLQIVCNCDAKEPVLLVGNGIGKCPACPRMFQLQAVRGNPKGGLEFAVGLVATTPATEPEPPAPIAG